MVGKEVRKTDHCCHNVEELGDGRHIHVCM